MARFPTRHPGIRASPDQRQQHFEALTAHHKQLEIWAEHCPENFENRAALVGAEIARIEGRELDAKRLYEQAIRSARANGFVHNEALANELAARFYTARGFETDRASLPAQRPLLLSALGSRWQGAATRSAVSAAQARRASARTDEHDRGAGRASGPRDRHQRVASGVGRDRPGKTARQLMRTAIEHAGAERGLLILSRGDDQRIEAEATTNGDTIVVQLRDQLLTAAVLPESVLHYVLRTQESVILDDAAGARPVFGGSTTSGNTTHVRFSACRC